MHTCMASLKILNINIHNYIQPSTFERKITDHSFLSFILIYISYCPGVLALALTLGLDLVILIFLGAPCITFSFSINKKALMGVSIQRTVIISRN